MSINIRNAMVFEIYFWSGVPVSVCSVSSHNTFVHCLQQRLKLIKNFQAFDRSTKRIAIRKSIFEDSLLYSQIWKGSISVPVLI